MQTACFVGQHAADRATKLLSLSSAGWEQHEEEGCCSRVGIGVARRCSWQQGMGRGAELPMATAGHPKSCQGCGQKSFIGMQIDVNSCKHMSPCR